MILTFLGTGTSQGVPVIGCTCEVCLSSDRLDHRLRTSAWIHDNNHSILIDIGPDFRQQALSSGIRRLDAILLTHEHADHTAGLDDIRPINFMEGPVPLFGLHRVLEDIQKRFHYIFGQKEYPGLPELELHSVIPGNAFSIADLTIRPIQVTHGSLAVLGYRIGSLCYITDASAIAQEEIQEMQGCDILILNALRKKKHHSHLCLEEALAYIRAIQPKRAFLTHISHQMGLHKSISSSLPPNIEIAFDGLSVNFGNESTE